MLQDFPEFESLIKREGLKPVVSKFKVYPKLCTIGYSSSSSSFLSPRSPSKSFLGRGEEGGPLLDLFVSKLKPRMLGENRVCFCFVVFVFLLFFCCFVLFLFCFFLIYCFF